MGHDPSNFRISSRAQAKLSDRYTLIQELRNGTEAKDLMEFSSTTMYAFATAAYQLLKNGKYSDAMNAYLFLVTISPNHYDYWIGFGMAAQYCHEYETAIDGFELAAICNIEDPVSYFHLAHCLFAIHDRESALQAIDLAIGYADNRDEFVDLYRQAVAAKKTLLKEMQ